MSGANAWTFLFSAAFLAICGCGSGSSKSCATDAMSVSYDSGRELPSEGGDAVCTAGPAAFFIGDPAPVCCTPWPYMLVLDVDMTASSRVYDSQGTLLAVDEQASATNVWFSTGDLGPGEDVGDFSYRILSEDGIVLSAAGGPDPFRCFECNGPPPQVTFENSAPLIRGMAFYEILDKRFNTVLLLLDVRGFVQVFCMNNPCVDICQLESVDGGREEVHPSTVDAEIDGGGVDAGSLKLNAGAN